MILEGEIKTVEEIEGVANATHSTTTTIYVAPEGISLYYSPDGTSIYVKPE